MAIIDCPECGKEVSDKAVSCPHCGFEMNPKFSLFTMSFKQSVVCLIISIGILLFVHFCGKPLW